MNERIKHFREKAQLSQADLARLLDMSIQTIQGWEQGKRFPRTVVLPKLAEVLKCTPADLLQ